MSGYKETALHESFFRPGSSLCPGCMEAIALNNIGRVSDNGVKTIFALGTSCAEVSTLAYPNIVAWGRGEQTSPDVRKSFGIIHNVFESAPTVAEATRDVADLLTEAGALPFPVQVLSTSGDGGALAIGLRALLHTIHRRSRVLITVLVNEVFANTGFQYSPAAMPYSESSTTPVGAAVTISGASLIRVGSLAASAQSPRGKAQPYRSPSGRSVACTRGRMARRAASRP